MNFNTITTISDLYVNNGDFKGYAATAAGELYGYGHFPVLFKPMKARTNQFRPEAGARLLQPWESTASPAPRQARRRTSSTPSATAAARTGRRGSSSTTPACLTLVEVAHASLTLRLNVRVYYW